MKGGHIMRGSYGRANVHGKTEAEKGGMSNGLPVMKKSDGGVDDHTLSAKTRVKPPPTSSRKIVLSSKKDASGLENVNVKSLEEIKRDKAMREKSGTSTTSGASNLENSPTGQELNRDSSSTEVVNSKTIAIKPLTVQLKSLPSKTLDLSKRFSLASEAKVSATTRPSLDGWTEPDLESLADEEDLIWEDADDCDLGDSDDLLDEEEFEEEKEEDYIVDYSDVPLGSTHGEDTMEMISLHPDDSLFDEELDNKELGPVRPVKLKGDDHDLRGVMMSGQDEEGKKSSHGNTRGNRAKKDECQSDRQPQGARQNVGGKHEKPSSATKSGMQRPHGNRGDGCFLKPIARTHMMRVPRGRGRPRIARGPARGVMRGFFGLPHGPPLRMPGLPPPRFLMNGGSQMKPHPLDSPPHEHEFIPPGPPVPPVPRWPHWRRTPSGSPGRMMRTRGGIRGPQGFHFDERRVRHQRGGHLASRVIEHGVTTRPTPGWNSDGNIALPGNNEDDEKPKEVKTAAFVDHGRKVDKDVSHDSASGVAPKLNVGNRFGSSPARHSPVSGQDQQGAEPFVTGRPGTTSPFHESEQPKPGNKRKSPAHIDHEVGRKMQVKSSPTGEPGVLPMPLGFCWQQLDTGQCRRAVCNYKHLPPQELEEYQQRRRLKECESLQRKQPQEAQLEHNVHQNWDPSTRQMTEQTPQQMKEMLVVQLDNKELGAAWQTIEKMSRRHHIPEVQILERLLLLCSYDSSNSDIAGQVGCKVFDMIGTVKGKYNRHNYTTLITCLCQSGQYIRAYEMLGVMRKDNCQPTHEVFLDLIQASHADPHWAFNLLDEVKRNGLFKTSICSSLLILGCQSGPECLDKTWSLLEEMVQCQIQPSNEALKSLFKFLSDLKCWEKLVFVLRTCPTQNLLPNDVLAAIMTHACHHIHLADDVVKFLMSISIDKDPGVDCKVWQALLVACSSMEDASSTTQALVGLMEKFKVPLSPQSYDALMKTLVGSNLLDRAMDLFLKMTKDTGVSEELPSVGSGLLLLSEALHMTGEPLDMLKVVHFMLDNKIVPNEKVMYSAVLALDQSKNYQGLQMFFKQCQNAGITPPYNVCRQIVTSLEKWKENPLASLEPYAALRQAYPVLPSSNEKHAATSENNLDSFACQPPICRYYNSTGGCRFGTGCRFRHHDNSAVDQKLTEGELHPGVNSDDSLNPFVLRRPSKLPDTAHALVDVQSHVPPTSPSSSGHSLQMRGRSGPPDQAEPPTLVPAVPSLETASMTPNKSSCQRVHPSQMGWFGPPAVPGVAKSEESQNLWAEVKAKSSPFQLRSPVPGPNLQPIDATHSVGIAPVQDPMRNPFAVAQAAGERPRVWRTRSSDSHTFVADVKTESQTRSAPISGSDLGFYFPGKERIEFYLPQIKFTGQERNWVGLARIYSDIKAAGLEIGDGLLKPFVTAFTSNQADNVSEGFDTFIKELRLCLRKLPDGPQTSNELELCGADEILVGRIAVSLMNFCLQSQRFSEGYNVLYTLHECGINYSKCGGTVGLQGETMTKAEIVLMAVEICLTFEPMQCGSALEVLRGSNFALPTGNGQLSPDEATRRRNVLIKLHGKFLEEGNFDAAQELLEKIGTTESFGVGPQKDIYNAFVRRLLQEGKLDKALQVLEQMETSYISRDPETIRALVRALASSGDIMRAKKEFKAGCVSGVYPASLSESNPWSVAIPTSFVRFEVQCYLENHLSQLQELTEGQVALYGDEELNRFRIFVTSNEARRLYSGFLGNEDKAASTKEIVVSVIENQLNPPLSCIPAENEEEILVSPSSLRRWFLANPATRRQKKGAMWQSDEVHPYLQSGIIDQGQLQESHGSTGITVSLIPQANGKSGRIVRQGSEERTGLGGWHDLDRTSLKARREKVAHVIRGQLTLCLRQGRLHEKDFKETARGLTLRFMKEHNTVDEESRGEFKDKVRSFVNKFV